MATLASGKTEPMRISPAGVLLHMISISADLLQFGPPITACTLPSKANLKRLG